MRKILLTSLLFLFLLPKPAQAWDTIQTGLSHQAITYQSGTIHLYRIDLQKFNLELLDARQYGSSALSIRDFAKKSKALLLINGGFFQEKYSPLGLMVQKGQQLNPLRRVEWGVFYIENNIAKIKHTRKFELNSQITTALQSGPRLVIGGTIPSLLPGEKNRRSAIGINSNGKVIIAITQNAFLNMNEWAQLMKRHCSYALNLDGGGSSQLYFKSSNQKLYIPGGTPVPNALAIFSH